MIASAAQARNCTITDPFVGPTDNCERVSTDRSSWIESITWCADHTLFMKVKSGRKRLYRYADVPREAFDAFRDAPSPGGYFNREFGPRYDCTRANDQAKEGHAEPP